MNARDPNSSFHNCHFMDQATPSPWWLDLFVCFVVFFFHMCLIWVLPVMQSVVCTCNYKHRTIDFPNSLSRWRVLLPTKKICFPCRHYTPRWLSPPFSGRGSNDCHPQTRRHRAIRLTRCFMVLLYLSNFSLLYMNVPWCKCSVPECVPTLWNQFCPSSFTWVSEITLRLSVLHGKYLHLQSPSMASRSLKLTLPVSCQEEKKYLSFMFPPTLPHWIAFVLCFFSIHKDGAGKGSQCAKHPSLSKFLWSEGCAVWCYR